MKKEDGTSGGDEDFVTKTNKATRKKINKALSEDSKDLSSTGASGSSSSANAEGISLRPRTMFTVKGRGRTEPEASPAYRPQWSKDGDGFVSNTPANKESGGEHSGGERRKGKVLRYTKEELLALHVTTTSPPSFPPDTVVVLEEPLPPVSSVPFDYDEIYKQWALNRNRGRGRGRTTGGTTNTERGNTTGRTDGKWEDSKWEGKSRRGEDRSNGREESRWERGAAVETESTSTDMWDDVGVEGGDCTELDLSAMAAAAESFRKEMDAMRDQVRQMELETAKGTDMDEFDQKLEKAAAAGQFEDNEEEVQWDTPTTELEDSSPLPDDNLTFSSFKMTLDPRDEQLSLSPEPKPSIVLDEPTFSLPSLSDNAFDLGSLALERVEDEWFYLDPQNLQQGPFKTAEMREWFEAGYFKPNLPIRFSREGVFTPLANHFSQGQLPFASIPRPSPRISEQQRMMELHRQQQQQQQQMLLLQQQQEQERIMQFNREEKIRLEMQRLEIARQQQNHVFQQQQMIHQQQQQQQQLLLQQQQLQQQHLQQQHQQSSWQQSQRQGIMSALGIFGGGDQSSMGTEMSLGFPPDNRNPQVYPGPVSPVAQESNFVKLGNTSTQDPWGLGVNRMERPRDVTHDASPFVGAQEVHTSPRDQTEAFVDPWGKPKVVEKPPVQEQPPQVETQQPVEQSRPRVSEPRETRREEARSRPQTAEREKAAGEKPPKKEKVSVANKEKSKQARGNESEKGAWSSSAKSVSSSAKSLKDIQEEEQRELRKTQEDKGEPADLASMDVQLKMMLGVNESGPAAASSSATPTQPAPAPTASPWGKTAVVAQPLNSSKSMREILAEEERLAAERAKRSDAAPTSSHWVNVVAGNTATPVVAPKAARIPVPSSVLKSTTRTRTSVIGEITGVLKKPTSTPTKESDASFWNFGAAQTSKFGGSASSGAVSSDFMAWCATQIKSINGSDDLTLVEYCATLEDPGEIREYMAAYLGSTPKVSAFASEFIQRKKTPLGGSKKHGQVADSGTADADSGNNVTSGAKKQTKRRTKGQKIDPSLLNYSVGS